MEANLDLKTFKFIFFALNFIYSFWGSQSADSAETSWSVQEIYGTQMAIPFWIMATYTGVSRIADDKHWLIDVIMGATFGVVFTKSSFEHKKIIPQVSFEGSNIKNILVNSSWTY